MKSAPSQPAKRVAGPYAPYILVADDDPQVRGLFRRLLEDAGYRVVEAASGREALKACYDRMFDAVIIDLSLPDTDGLALVGEILRELPLSRILVTSGFLPDWRSDSTRGDRGDAEERSAP